MPLVCGRVSLARVQFPSKLSNLGSKGRALGQSAIQLSGAGAHYPNELYAWRTQKSTRHGEPAGHPYPQQRTRLNALLRARIARPITTGGSDSMARKVFYSFHSVPDCTRAARVRDMGVVEGNPPATDNDWEKITKG